MLSSTFAIATLMIVPITVQAGSEVQDTAITPAEKADEIPIIVTAETDEAEIKSQQLGSRIARKPLFTNLNMATSTGLSGLTPGSGMSPYSLRNPVIKKYISSCSADNTAIGKKAACLLLSAEQSIAAGQSEAGADIYRFLASSQDFNPQERLTGGERLFALGASLDNSDIREEALIRLLNSDVLPAPRALSAHHTLVSMALTRGDFAAVIEQLEHVTTLAPDDAQSHANLAIFKRQEGVDGAEKSMTTAIAAREAIGGDVPESWRSF